MYVTYTEYSVQYTRLHTFRSSRLRIESAAPITLPSRRDFNSNPCGETEWNMIIQISQAGVFTSEAIIRGLWCRRWHYTLYCRQNIHSTYSPILLNYKSLVLTNLLTLNIFHLQSSLSSTIEPPQSHNEVHHSSRRFPGRNQHRLVRQEPAYAILYSSTMHRTNNSFFVII